VRVEGAARIHPGPHLIKRRPQAFWLTEREGGGRTTGSSARRSSASKRQTAIQTHGAPTSGQRPATTRSRQARQSAKPPARRTVRQHRPKSQRTETSNCAQPTGASECKTAGQTRGATAPPQEPADRDQQLRAADRRVRVQSHRPAARCDSTAPRASGQRPAAVRSRQARQSAKPPSSRTVQKHTQKPADRDRQIRTADRRVRAQNRRPDARYDSTAPKASGQRPAAVRSLQARQSAKPPSSRTIRQHRPESQRTATALRTMRPGWPKRWFG
jgi:hypothetical protein